VQLRVFNGYGREEESYREVGEANLLSFIVSLFWLLDEWTLKSLHV